MFRNGRASVRFNSSTSDGEEMVDRSGRSVRRLDSAPQSKKPVQVVFVLGKTGPLERA